MPRDVRALSLPEYLAMVKLMDDDRRERERQMRKAKSKGRG